MSYMYRLTPEILSFHPIPSFIFPLSPFKEGHDRFTMEPFKPLSV